jgi:hypothetical protein
MIVLGLVVLVAAVVVGVAGVLGNRGVGHALVHPFSVFGYHVTGSEGRLFLYGIVVGSLNVRDACCWPPRGAPPAGAAPPAAD